MALQEHDFRSYFEHYYANLRPRANGQAIVRCPFHDDRNPSLSINLKRGLWYCFGGCGGGGILEFEIRKNGGTPKAAWAQACKIIGRPLNGAGPEPVAVYDYTDEAGKLQYQVLRLPGKKFTQRQPDAHGGWLWHLKGARRVPYRLPELLKATQVFIPEGEKDVETLRSLGLVATTNSGGASKWQVEFGQYLTGKDVVILPDNDDPGRKHAEQVAATLLSVARSIKVVPLPGLGPGGDVSDFCAKAGAHSKGLLLVAVEDAHEWKPAPADNVALSAPIAEDAEHLTDSGNARRIVNMHGQDLRYSPAWGTWLIWSRTHWKPDETGEIVRRAQLALRSIYNEAEAASGKQERKELLRWAEQSEAQGKIQAAISLAQSAADVVVTPEMLDGNPWLLNCQNGTLDLRTLELRPHKRDDLLTKCLTVGYDPNATCPTFDRFLDKVMGADHGLKHYLQAALDTRSQASYVNNVSSSFTAQARTARAPFSKPCEPCWVITRGTRISRRSL
jgi:putative DNA primase/helicase